MLNDLVIKQKFDDMVQYAYIALEHFPKSQRYVMGAEIRLCMENIDSLIIRAQKQYFKKTTLQDLDIAVAQLQSKINRAKGLGYLPNKKHELWSRMLIELGRMVGGWIKSAQNRAPADMPIAAATATTARSARVR